MFSPKLILSPIDFSDFSLNALDAARDVATHYASEILLLHVVPMVPELSEYASNFSEGVYEHELIETAKQRLGELTVKLKQRGTGARSLVVLANHPAHEITRTAAAEKVDLI